MRKLTLAQRANCIITEKSRELAHIEAEKFEDDYDIIGEKTINPGNRTRIYMKLTEVAKKHMEKRYRQDVGVIDHDA